MCATSKYVCSIFRVVFSLMHLFIVYMSACHTVHASAFINYFLDCRCEQLLGVNGNLRQEVMLVKEDHRGDLEFHTLEDSLERLIQTLIQR